MGIFGRILDKIKNRKKKPEAGKIEPDSTSSSPLSPQSATSPVEKPAEAFLKEMSGLKPESEPGGKGVKLPVKKHILKEPQDPFSKKEKSRIFADNLDLIELFKKGEFSEKEILRRQRSAIKARLKRKRIDPEKASGVLDDYGYYFRKELEEAKKIRKAKEEAVE